MEERLRELGLFIMEIAEGEEGRGGEGTGLIAVFNQGHREDRARLFSEVPRTKSNNFQTLQ